MMGGTTAASLLEEIFLQIGNGGQQTFPRKTKIDS
jgi:hypothetical protein